MPKPKIFNRYENMEFPKYVFHEYPKLLGPEGKRVTVHSPEEEEATLAKLKLPVGRKNKLSNETEADLTEQATEAKG